MIAPTMYDVIFQNDYHGQYVVVAQSLKSLEEASNSRQVSGDIVVHHNTTNVVRDEAWLWDWEKNDDGCYAKRRIQKEDVEGHII